MTLEKTDRRILFVTQLLKPDMGYIGNFLPEQLIGDGLDVAVLAPFEYRSEFIDTGLCELHYEHVDFSVYRHTVTNVKYFFMHFKLYSIGHLVESLRSIIAYYSPDVVQSLIITIDIINLQIASLSKKFNFDFFLQDHSSKSTFSPNCRGKIWQLFFRLFLSKYLNSIISGCFYPSPDIRRIVTQKYGISERLMIYQTLGTDRRLFHLPSLIDLNRARNFRRELGIPESVVLFLYAGRLTKAKGIDFILKAFRQVNSSINNVWLLLVGDLLEPEIFENLESRNNIIIKERVPVSQLPIFYWLADFGIWPKEGSTSIMDAIASGLPVILRSGITEPERRAHPSMTFEDGNWQSLATVMQYAAEHISSESREEFQATGRGLIKGWDSLATDRILDFYFSRYK